MRDRKGAFKRPFAQEEPCKKHPTEETIKMYLVHSLRLGKSKNSTHTKHGQRIENRKDTKLVTRRYQAISTMIPSCFQHDSKMITGCYQVEASMKMASQSQKKERIRTFK